MQTVRLRTSTGSRTITIDGDFVRSLGVSGSENLLICELFVASWLTLLSDSPLEAGNKPYKLYLAFLKGMQTRGLKATILQFADLAHVLMSQHQLTGQSTLIGDWIDGFKDTPVFFEYHRYFQTEDPVLLSYLYTFLCFGKKLEYEDEEFKRVAFRDWQDIEKRLSDQVLLEADTGAIRYIMETLLPRFTIEDYRPKFGPGSVAERGVVGRIGKLRNFHYDGLIDRFLFHGHIGRYGFGEDQGLSMRQVIPNLDRWSPDRQVSSRTALLIFVRKNMKVARSICEEPNLLMYNQQGIMRRFLELIGSSEYRHFIDIRDQSNNRDLALHGSVTGEIDTIDLSAASDSLSTRLVKAVFPASWKIPMLVTRSDKCVLPDGKIHHLAKFAPMGSALCFPTQCLVFASAGVYAHCLYLYEQGCYAEPFLDWLRINLTRVLGLINRTTTSYGLRFQPMAVYGDDICCDQRVTGTLMAILSRLGFTVNVSKSFIGSQAFRESCGGFYLNGHDVTPTYFRVKEVRRKLTAEHVESQVHLTNACWVAGYKNLYRFLKRTLMTWDTSAKLRNKQSKWNPIPYVTDAKNFGILCLKPSNSHLKHREQPDVWPKPFYQRTEYRCWAIRAQSRTYAQDILSDVDAYEYMRWWASRSGNSVPSASESEAALRYDTGGAGLCWVWTPAE